MFAFLANVLKHNPYHDQAGKFTTGESAHFVSIGGKFKRPEAKQTAWKGSIDADLKLPEPVHKAITATMHELSTRYPSLANIKVSKGDWLEGGDTLATKSKTQIILNESKWNQEGFLASHEKDWDGAMVDASVKGIIVHEAGHILDGQLLDKLGGKKYDKMMKTFLPEGEAGISNEMTTPYGMENRFELMAETFTSHYFNKGPNGAHPDILKKQVEYAHNLWTAVEKELA